MATWFNDHPMTIRPLAKQDIPAIKLFTDRTIGTNYFSESELLDILARSEKDNRQCSLGLFDQMENIRGIRITFPPGNWSHGKGKGLSPSLWKVELKDMGYFQSLFIDPPLTGQGWGKKLSLKSIEILKDLGAKAILCHSWKESPNDSSGRYLRSLGFELVNVHPYYWKEVDYQCTRCGKPCLCTAEEMIKYL